MSIATVLAQLQAELANGTLSATISGKSPIFFSGIDPETKIYNGKQAEALVADDPDPLSTELYSSQIRSALVL